MKSYRLMDKKRTYFLALATLCLIALFLFLGESSFHTRGEPREAVVALSMLERGNWILPVNRRWRMNNVNNMYGMQNVLLPFGGHRSMIILPVFGRD